MQARPWYAQRDSWSFILGRYLPRLLALNLGWEILQLPLYTLASDPRLGWIAYAIVHCTLGDALIGGTALVGALTICRAQERPHWRPTLLLVWTVLLSVSYTVASEWHNLSAGGWAYSSLMPIVPGLEVGLSPLLQWLSIPVATWWWAGGKPHTA